MSKFLKGMLAAVLMLSLTAAPSLATSVGIGVSNTSVLDWHLIGIGASVNVPFSNGTKQFNADARYEFGNYKEEDEGPPSTEFEEKISGFRVRAGVDHVVQVAMAMLYLGSGLSYSTHKFETSFTGSPDFESEPYSVFGVNSRLGVTGPFGEGSSVYWFGQFENTFGWGSYDENGFKVTQNDVSNGFQGGVQIHFGQNGAN